MPRNLHAKRSATQCKAKQTRSTTRHVTSWSLNWQQVMECLSKDQTKRMRIYMAGLCPFTLFTKGIKKVKAFPRKCMWGRRPELKIDESLRRISENNDWCVGRNEAGKLGKAEKQNPVRIRHDNQPLRVRTVGWQTCEAMQRHFATPRPCFESRWMLLSEMTGSH